MTAARDELLALGATLRKVLGADAPGSGPDRSVRKYHGLDISSWALFIDKMRLRRETWRAGQVYWRPGKGDPLRPLEAADREKLHPLLRIARRGPGRPGGYRGRPPRAR
jgi:hypothetical protein